MRTALLSAIKRDDHGQLRALLPLAGRSVLGWQIDFARSLGCDRIMCLCEQQPDELLALQGEVERDGGEFHLVRSNTQLAALMRSGEQVVMLLDGLVPDPADTALFETGRDRLRALVVALPSDADVAAAAPADFERIDAERCWSGMTVFAASTAAKIADYPLDSEAVSLLLRLALQDGVPCELRKAGVLGTSYPLLATSRESLSSHQKNLLKTHSEAAIWSAPFTSIARRLAAKLVLKEGSSSPAALLGVSAAAFTVTVLLLWLNQDGFALALASVGAFCAQAAISSETLMSRLRSRGKTAAWRRFVSPIVDLAAVGALTISLDPAGAPFERFALSAFAIGLARIAAHQNPARMGAFWGDRTLHLGAFATAAFTGVLAPFATVFGLGALAYKVLPTLRN